MPLLKCPALLGKRLFLFGNAHPHFTDSGISIKEISGLEAEGKLQTFTGKCQA